MNWGYTACWICATIGVLLITSSFFVNDENVDSNLKKSDLPEVSTFQEVKKIESRSEFDLHFQIITFGLRNLSLFKNPPSLLQPENVKQSDVKHQGANNEDPEVNSSSASLDR